MMLSTTKLCLITTASFLVSSRCSAQQAAEITPKGAVVVEGTATQVSASYGADCSWPMKNDYYVNQESNPLGYDERQSSYDRFMEGCPTEACKEWERDRLEMNLMQPAAMQNYTHAGFAKVPAPERAMGLLQEFWRTHKDQKVLEVWEEGNTYVNHWESPSHLLDVSHPQFGIPEQQRWEIIRAIQSVLEAWTKQPLVLTSMYGIREYGPNAILAPHVDRLPLVSSAIVNVAQKVEEPWLLEVIGHDGKAHNVTMEAGDMVLYESHSIIHGRPFPLRGDYFANIFVHFEPLGHTLRHVERGTYGSDVEVPDHARLAYERALERAQREQEGSDDDNGLPAPTAPRYVPEEEEGRWQQRFEYEKEEKVFPKPTKATLGELTPHLAAAKGLLDTLKEIAKKDRSQLFKADQNGWRPLHEAARSGHTKVVEYLITEGANINERTNNGKGGNPLYLAEKKAGANSETIALLKKHGAVSLAPTYSDGKKKEKSKA